MSGELSIAVLAVVVAFLAWSNSRALRLTVEKFRLMEQRIGELERREREGGGDPDALESCMEEQPPI